MPLHNKAFWGIVFFLIGILFAGFVNYWQEGFLIIVLAAFITALTFLVFNNANRGKFKWFAGLTLFMVFGAGYYLVFDNNQKNINIPYDKNSVIEGLVIDVSKSLVSQTLVLKLLPPHKGNIQIMSDKYPEFKYGDILRVNGSIRRPSDSASNYFEKEGIFGLSGFSKIEILEKGKGSRARGFLFAIKSFVESSFNRFLPKEKSSFMSGLILGETSEFDKKFKEKMSITGTTHLVALSGYNITIIAKAIVLSLGIWLSRRKTFWISLVAIFGFVVMTGSDASVVRAAIMAVLVLLADRLERAYSFRNSIAIAAFLMILFNPKILLFDIGFQLSFAAVMGLIYLKPAIHMAFKIKNESGILAWRENLTTTLSAQAAVLPIILSNFGLFSPISLATNVLILTFIPITMFLGAMVVVLGIFSDILAQVFAWIANIFLSYELWIIDVFAKIKLQISVQNFSIVISIIYYFLLIGLIMHSKKKSDYLS